MRALTSFDNMANNPKQAGKLPASIRILAIGLFFAVLALAAPSVSAQETTQSPLPEVASNPLPETSSEPVSDNSAAEPNALESSSEPAAESLEPATPDAAVPADPAEDVSAEPRPAASAPQSLKDSLLQILDSSEASDETGPDLSPIGMFRGADIVVKLVMLGLIFGSLLTWTISFSKTIEIAGAVRRARRVLRTVNESRSMEEASRRAASAAGPAAEMLRAVSAEAEFSRPVAGYVTGDGLKERVTSVLDQISARAGRRAAVGTGILATIGSTAPFVGLFGTVWGIMNSFIGISEAQTSSLAVVAPGIAEALLATALGLVAAIPAVIIYNLCARWTTGYRHILSEVAAGIERLISRDLDFRQLPAGHSSDAQAAE